MLKSKFVNLPNLITKKMEFLIKIQKYIAEGDYEHALNELSEAIAKAPDAALYFERGKLYWRLGNRAKAASDYAEAAALDTASPAAEALRHAQEVEAFFNPDLLNP